MTKDDIIRMTRESQKENFHSDTGHWFHLEVRDLARFAEMVAAAEREACAKVCEAEASVVVVNASEEYQKGKEMGATVCAAAIRERMKND